MFQATCGKCGNNCEVPFRPRDGKSVLCSSCFNNQGGSDRGRSGDRDGRSFDRNRRSGDRTMHEAVCDSCGNKCEVPFRPTGGKPIYCKECFGKKSSQRERHGGKERHGGGNEQVSQQLKELSSKLDRVIGLLDPEVHKKEPSTEETTAKSVPKKPSKQKAKAKAGKKPKKKSGKKKK